MDWNFLTTLQFNSLDLDARDREILDTLAQKLQDNYPYAAPEYAGQMIKPPHHLAQAAHWMTSFINPNNHALDGGRATSALELECIQALGTMIGYDQPLGHLTSGGTVANLEALWVARQNQPTTKVLASAQSHYTHQRMSEVLGMEFGAIGADEHGRMDLGQLEEALKILTAAGRTATIVATMGTTGMGAVDPLHDILELAGVYGARVHADAAYGGYFKLCALNEASDEAAFAALGRADSVVIDPHKHGLQPYGCGAVLFKNPKEGKFYKHDSPYTYFTSDQLHLGEITLECSRPGAAAAALWATLQKFPLEKGGEFAQRLEHSLAAARGLTQLLEDEGYWVMDPALDICVFSKKGLKASQVSAENREFFEEQARAGVHLALFKLAPAQCPWPMEWDQDELVVVRSVLMKPEHNDPKLWEKIAGLA